jgi:type II secretion system protein H
MNDKGKLMKSCCNSLRILLMRNKTGQKGFTLVEVMIVVAIIGILTAIATPALLAWLPNVRLKAAARDLYSKMQRTRMEAIRTNGTRAIVFDPPTNSYLVCSSSGADTNWSTIADNTVTETVDLSTYNSGIGFGHGTATTSVPVGAFPIDNVSYTSNVLTFNNRGIGTAGYVYLDNQNHDNTVYAIGTQSSGVVMLRRWTGGGWQ